MSDVLRWWPGEPGHPVIDELKSRPGEWGVIWDRADSGPLGDCEPFWACDQHRRVEVHVLRPPGIHRPDQSVSARWIPDEEWADIQARKLAVKEGYGG